MDILSKFTGIDITDKTILESQFNYARENWYEAIKLMENISKKISELKEENIEYISSIYSKGLSTQAVNAQLKADEDYQKRLLEIEGYETGLKILEEKINFIKSDIRILSNSMYNKF